MTGAPLTQQPVVELRDTSGSVVDDDVTGVTVTVDQGGVLGGSTTVSAVAGVLSFTDLTLTGTVGTTYTLTFAVGNLRTTDTVSLPPVLFALAENGVTIICPDSSVGDEGDVGGVTYTKRARADVGETSGLDTLIEIGPGATGWDLLPATCTSGIESFDYLLSDLGDATFNGDVGGWDTSSVTSMDYMFRDAAAFDQELGSRCVTNVLVEPEWFDEGVDNWTSGRPIWVTVPSMIRP